MNKNDLAKEIFLKYAGSYFHMIRDEKYKEYKQYNISKELENKWIEEYQNDKLNKLNMAEEEVFDIFISLCDTIKNYNSLDFLNELLTILINKVRNKEIDSFNQLIISEQLLKIVKSYREKNIKTEIINDAKEFAVNILYNLVNEPLKYEEEINEQDIIVRAKNCLEEWT